MAQRQLLIVADRVQLGRPPDAPEGAPVMGGFTYEEPADGVEFAVNVHDVYVDELGSYANVSVIYSLPAEAETEDAATIGTESNGTATLHVIHPDEED